MVFDVPVDVADEFEANWKDGDKDSLSKTTTLPELEETKSNYFSGRGGGSYNSRGGFNNRGGGYSSRGGGYSSRGGGFRGRGGGYGSSSNAGGNRGGGGRGRGLQNGGTSKTHKTFE